MFETAFMIFGIAFFIYVIWMVQVAEERNYQRKLHEAREFGRRVILDEEQNDPQDKSK